MKRNAYIIKCHDVQEMAVSYFQGLLNDTFIEEVDSHLKRCGDCRREYKILRELHRLDQARSRGAIDPGLFPEMDTSALSAPEGDIGTVNALLQKLVQVEADSSFDDPGGQKQKVFLLL